MWWGYFGVVARSAMSDDHLSTLVVGVQKLGSQNHPQPGKRNVMRQRKDGRAAIFEAELDRSNLTVEWFTIQLAALFEVSPASIDASLSIANWGGQSTPVATFEWLGTPYLVMTAFAGVDATREESGDAARAYLAANAEDWESTDQE